MIGELNTERARQAANASAIEIAQQNLADCENQFMEVTGRLNERLHRVEILYGMQKERNLNDVDDIGRITDCLHNAIALEFDRRKKGGGKKNLPSRLKNPDELSYPLRVSHVIFFLHLLLILFQ